MAIQIGNEEFDFLKDEAAFTELLTRDASGEEIELDYWQRAQIRDESRFIHVVKSRQVGFSWIESAKSLARMSLRVDYRKYFTSINLDESKEKIRYVRQMYDSLPERFKLRVVTDAKTEFAVQDHKGRISLVKALTSRAPRGMHGDITLDEFAHYLAPQKIYDAAIALISRGGQLVVGSSPMSRQGVFYDIYENKVKNDRGEPKYAHFQCYSVPWWFSHHLCTDVRGAVAASKSLNTRQRIDRFGTDTMKDIFASYSLDAFIQEYECGFVDEQTAFMPIGIIRDCEEPNYGKGQEDGDEDNPVKMLCRIEEYAGDDNLSEKKNVIDSFVQWIRKNKTGFIEAGYDVGRHRDISALVVTEELNNGTKEVRAILGLDHIDFETQLFVCRLFLDVVQPHAFRIDKGGLGEMLAETLANQYPGIVEPHQFSSSSKGIMAQQLKRRFQNKTIRIPAWQKLISHIHSIKKTVTASNNLVYEADASDHHGDYYWALALTEYRGSSGDLARYEPAKFSGIRRISSRDFD